VLDPTLIPISVDVVIGDNVYELHFKVEPEEMNDNPSPLDMEKDGDDVDKMDEGDGGINDQGDLMQEDQDTNPRNKGSSLNSMPNHSDQQGGFKKMAADHQALEESYVGEDDMLFDREDDELGDTLESEGRTDDEIQEVCLMVLFMNRQT
jgi:hypothetical protein